MVSLVRRACIDIGSNTTRLLVADCDGARGLQECHQERVFNQIGAALDADGAIPAEKLEEVVQTVIGQLGSARRLGASDVRCVATAAVRAASNAAELLSRLEAACAGMPVTVLTSEAEARYAFAGAIWGAGLSAPDREFGVADVGGGSSELVVGLAPDQVQWWLSLPFGSGDLCRGQLVGDPPTADALSSVREWLADQVSAVEVPLLAGVIAVGGSATSLRRFAGDRLDRAAFDRALALLSAAPAAQVAATTGLELERVRLLPAGLLILEAIFELCGIPLQIGVAGMREGILLEAAATSESP